MSKVQQDCTFKSINRGINCIYEAVNHEIMIKLAL